MNVRFPARPAPRPTTFARQRLGPVQRFADGREVRQQYVAHNGKRAMLRNLRRLTRGLVVPVEIESRIAAVTETLPPRVDREHVRFEFLARAKAVSDANATPFADALDYAIGKPELEMTAAQEKAS